MTDSTPGSGNGETGEEVVLTFGVDLNFLPHLGVVLASILDNAPGIRLRSIILHDGVPDDERRKLETCAPGHRFEWLEIKDDRLLALGGRRHFSRASLYRLSIADLAPADAGRIIYLDADLVVTADLRDLWRVDLGGRLIGAVTDPGVDAEAFAKAWDLPPQRLGYFNSGVLLLDLDGIRASNALTYPMEVLKSRYDALEYPDQDALNIGFWDRWARLDPLWNVQRRMVMPREGKPCFATPEEMHVGRRPRIIHYTESNKPWSTDAYHPFTWKYYHYLKKTPYWDLVCEKAQTTFVRNIRRRLKTRINWARLAS